MNAILLLFFLFIFGCTNNRNEQAPAFKIYTEANKNPSLGNSTKKNDGIVFIDNDSIVVKTNCYTDSIIDSIAIKYKTFKGIYEHCGKGILNIDLFSCLRKFNNKEFRELEMITTAHTIEVNKSRFYFNGKRSIDHIPNTNSPVLVDAVIYSLFSHDIHICNVLVINSIHEERVPLPERIKNGD